MDNARQNYLAERTSDPTVTVAEFQEFCQLLAAPALRMGQVAPDIDWFVTDAMLLEFWLAVDWWPRDIPAHPVPRLRELALQYTHLPDKPALTLSDILRNTAARVVAVLEADDRNVVNPNESDDERKLRKNRERQRRFRERQKLEQAGDAGSDAGAQGDTAAERSETPAAAAALREQIAALKAQRATAETEANAWVREAWLEMRDRASKRKAHLAHLDTQIVELEQQWVQHSP